MQVHHNAKEALDKLVNDSECITALLISREGVSIEESGNTGYLNTTALAALIAGMFTATREVARMVGEEHFSILLQQGTNRHIHISLINETVMMVIIFEDYQRIGKVRYEAKKASEVIANIMQPEPEASVEKLNVAGFREYALNLIDRIFDKPQG
ncbi:roadblock/LC7 domain-containing protein [Myxococcota bacterium]|nr:roadblock/LC7 domain-containing protein [Myxococcota bacterium]MBU1382592.1 roadblock/LC7 domain-containing protein [Myxococcota bacterium]MBU1495809.1 roadblock/LC7 domain-containing protein [Myxococcota bacterium]